MERAESCWYCTGDLCPECWDEFGHCGHAEATAINDAMLRADGYDERRAVFMDFLDRSSG